MAYHGALRREQTHRQKWTFKHMVEEAEEVMREQDNVIKEQLIHMSMIYNGLYDACRIRRLKCRG